MKLLKILILIIIIILCFSLKSGIAYGAVAYDNMDSSFTTIIKGTDLQKIETWEQPRTKYTPANLRSQYQIRFSGKDSSNSYTSYTLPITDYDTYVTDSKVMNDGKYYIIDNTGRQFVTGEVQQKVDLKPINNQLNNIQSQVYDNSQRINQLDNKIESGLATVTALTGLHPNPRSSEKLEVSLATGMYADNVAGAIGIFYHPNNSIQVNIGASYGGDSQFAGNCGITFSIGKTKGRMK